VGLRRCVRGSFAFLWGRSFPRTPNVSKHKCRLPLLGDAVPSFGLPITPTPSIDDYEKPHMGQVREAGALVCGHACFFALGIRRSHLTYVPRAHYPRIRLWALMTDCRRDDRQLGTKPLRSWWRWRDALIPTTWSPW